MTVLYTRIESVAIDPRILEEYFELEEDADKLSPETMAELFSEIPMSDLVDLSETFTRHHEIYKV